MKKLYSYLILRRPLLVLSLVGLLLLFCAYFSSHMQLDASADSLILENDKALSYYRTVRAQYGSDENLIITYKPHQDLFFQSTLDSLAQLKAELLAVNGVDSVNSILDVPLIKSPSVSLGEIEQGTNTLSSPSVDRALAREELLTSPLFKNLIISPDGKTTAIEVIFSKDKQFAEIASQRDVLRAALLAGNITTEQQLRLNTLDAQFKSKHQQVLNLEEKAIADIREILGKYRGDADIYLGGIPMIVADMIDYIGNDIEIFGVAVLVIVLLLLGFVFRKPRWIVIPLAVCFASVLSMMGLLGYMDWKITVVSSNFISLLLIISLSLMVHLIVRYQELHREQEQAAQEDLVWETVRSKYRPAFYTAITTMVAFGSLMVSGIRPVIDFGWMMFFGVLMAFILAFTMFPALLMYTKPGKIIHHRDFTTVLNRFFANLVERKTEVVFSFNVLLLIFSLVGVSQLTVENRFIDYFKPSSDIYQGMISIDRELGGTTPMDVVIDADAEYLEYYNGLPEDEKEELLSGGITASSYWFNMFELKTVENIHDYLESIPETGKVLSLATTAKLLRQLNNEQDFDNMILSVIFKRLPDNIKQILFDPYLSDDGNQIRFGIRVFESDATLQRQELIDKIRTDLQEKFGLKEDQIHVTGMVVLYNNLLQSLFTSQILTIGVVFLAILLMFVVLFRSIKLSIIAIIPNVVAAMFVLGIMGWMGIHLDIMTITIAAITIGIAVDNSIHYVDRFKREFVKDKDYWASIGRCHTSIGMAIFYTTVIIALGFSVLAFSNFIPTIYFGLLTGVAMLVALIANLTLLPVLMVKFRGVGG